MLSKLNTTFYHLKYDNNGKNHILPAYSICSKCYNDPEYIPSTNTINLLVNFFNHNLSPQISAYQFLHEDLEQTDSSRYCISTVLDGRFTGTYYCYYPSATGEGRISGAILWIYQDVSLIRAILINGIHSDDQLNSPALHSLFTDPSDPHKNYLAYYKMQSLESQSTFYYDGNVEITDSSLLIHFRCPDEISRKFTLTLNLQSFPSSVTRPYAGGMGFVLATSVNDFDARVYKMGIINAKQGSLSLATDGISELLQLPAANLSLPLTSAQDRKWYEFILAHSGKK